MEEKTCTKCLATKPLSDFVKDITTASGYAAICLECNKTACRIRYQKNKVTNNEQSALYYEARKEQITEYQKQYREKNREKLAQQKQEYYSANKVRLNEAMAEYAVKNADALAEYRKGYYAANKERILSNAKERVHKRSEWVRNKDAARRRYLSAELRIHILTELGGKCYCCGLDDLRFLTIDHVNNDGKHHRKLKSGSQKNGYIILLEIQKAGIPKDQFQAACYNCNCARNLTKDKICPHQLDKA